MSKHRPSVSNENYDSVMEFEGKTFNEKLSSVFNLRTQHVLKLHEAELRNSELNRKNNAADEHIVELNEKIAELDCLRDWLHAERKKSKELSDEYTRARLLYDDASAELSSTRAQLRAAQSERDRHKARAARYKFTTAIYGLCAIGFLIGWIYG